MSVALFDCLLFLTNEFFLLELLLLERGVCDLTVPAARWSGSKLHIFLGLWCIFFLGYGAIEGLWYRDNTVLY